VSLHCISVISVASVRAPKSCVLSGFPRFLGEGVGLSADRMSTELSLCWCLLANIDINLSLVLGKGVLLPSFPFFYFLSPKQAVLNGKNQNNDSDLCQWPLFQGSNAILVAS
jgi:hypothetical protein